MNLAHLHLALNHISLIGIPISILFFLYGSLRKDFKLQKFSLIVLILTGLFVLPTFWTGEPAEDVVKQIDQNLKGIIHPHEEAAEVSLTLTLISAALACLTLWISQKKQEVSVFFQWAILLISIATILSLAYTANLGGKIRHTELRSSQNLSSPNVAPESQSFFNKDTKGEEDDD